MKILILSQYFWPETFIINDIARILDEQGHEVLIATGKPNYPAGKILDGYDNLKIQREKYLNKIDIVRVPVYPRRNGSGISLTLNYISFLLAGLVCFPWILRKKEFDAIFVFAPSPILQAIAAIPLKWLKKAKLVLWIQDLWPESLSATGFIKNKTLLKSIGLLVQIIYKYCDLLLVQSAAFIEPVSRYANKDKITYYPNSIALTSSLNEKAILPTELINILENNFCIVFAGNLGTAQALDIIVQTAVRLKIDPEIRIVLVGSGSRLDWLKCQKKFLELDNLVLPGRFPMELMPQIFARASALLVSLTDTEIFAHTIPSKIQAYLAAGRPIIASINGEGARIIQEAQAGFTSPAEQVEPLVNNIQHLKRLSVSDRSSMGANGRAYFDAHFDMTKQVHSLVKLLS